jgi:hypothetical protein
MARMARALAMKLALSDTAEGEASDTAVDVTTLWGVPEAAGQSLLQRHP